MIVYVYICIHHITYIITLCKLNSKQMETNESICVDDSPEAATVKGSEGGPNLGLGSSANPSFLKLQ